MIIGDKERALVRMKRNEFSNLEMSSSFIEAVSLSVSVSDLSNFPLSVSLFFYVLGIPAPISYKLTDDLGTHSRLGLTTLVPVRKVEAPGRWPRCWALRLQFVPRREHEAAAHRLGLPIYPWGP